MGTAVIVWATAGALVGGDLRQQPSEKTPQAPARSAAASKPQPTASGNAQNGKALYEKYGCWACHGYQGQGGAGRRLAPDPIPLETFIALVRRPPSQMPPYTQKIVSDRELTDIHAFLGTIPAPPDPSTIPLLQEKKAGGTPQPR
jgi:ubiquinol-cytochrome c reductase cytochrome c subunit